IRACNDAVLPGGRLPLRVGGQQVGFLAADFAERVVELGGVRADGAVSLRPDQLQPVAQALAREGQYRWRGEAFDVRARPDGPARWTRCAGRTGSSST